MVCWAPGAAQTPKIDDFRPAQNSCIKNPGVNNDNSNFYLVFGRFPAELGPETRSNGSGSENGAERLQN